MTVFVDNLDRRVDTNSQEGEWIVGMKDGSYCDLAALEAKGLNAYEMSKVKEGVDPIFKETFNSFMEFYYGTETSNYLH